MAKITFDQSGDVHVWQPTPELQILMESDDTSGILQQRWHDMATGQTEWRTIPKMRG